MSTLAAPSPDRAGVLAALARGFRARPLTLALIVAINTGIALILWNNDTRPFWHPLLTCQIYGLCIAYAVNVAAPWEKTRPFRHMLGAIAVAVLRRRRPRRRAEGLFDRVRARALDGVRLEHRPGVPERTADHAALLRQVPRGARNGGAAPRRGRAQSAREAGGRGGAQADAGAGRAAFPVQHARRRSST